jgi:hypothetical protein
MGAGSRNRIWLWHEDDLETEDVYSAIAHCKRLVELVSRLLRSEVYLYHYKVIQKEKGNAETVSAGRQGNHFATHQDYGALPAKSCRAGPPTYN